MRSVCLTPGEYLELERRRCDLTQLDAAGLLGHSLHAYRRREKDLAGVSGDRVVELTDFEWCWLRRRRSGLSLTDVSEALGLSRNWISRAERGEVLQLEVLVEWWKQRAA